jgi:hypothetical protein
MTSKIRIFIFAGLGLALAAGMAHAQASAKPRVWVASWAASQQVPETQNSIQADDLRDATVRQIVHLSVGGTALRVHVSNEFGSFPLHFTSVHIARPLLSLRASRM